MPHLHDATPFGLADEFLLDELPAASGVPVYVDVNHMPHLSCEVVVLVFK
jgi:hypothetical protein